MCTEGADHRADLLAGIDTMVIKDDVSKIITDFLAEKGIENGPFKRLGPTQSALRHPASLPRISIHNPRQ